MNLVGRNDVRPVKGRAKSGRCLARTDRLTRDNRGLTMKLRINNYFERRNWSARLRFRLLDRMETYDDEGRLHRSNQRSQRETRTSDRQIKETYQTPSINLSHQPLLLLLVPRQCSMSLFLRFAVLGRYGVGGHGRPYPFLVFG